jgi:hypothetical protein
VKAGSCHLRNQDDLLLPLVSRHDQAIALDLNRDDAAFRTLA